MDARALMVRKLLFTREETARALGVHVNTVDRQIKAGGLEATRVGTRVFIDRGALQDFAPGLTDAWLDAAFPADDIPTIYRARLGYAEGGEP